MTKKMTNNEHAALRGRNTIWRAVQREMQSQLHPYLESLDIYLGEFHTAAKIICLQGLAEEFDFHNFTWTEKLRFVGMGWEVYQDALLAGEQYACQQQKIPMPFGLAGFSDNASIEPYTVYVTLHGARRGEGRHFNIERAFNMAAGSHPVDWNSLNRKMCCELLLSRGEKDTLPKFLDGTQTVCLTPVP